MANKVRSEYIQKLREDKDQLANAMQDVVKSAVQSFLDEGIAKNVRKIISEADEDEFEVEEVPADETPDTESAAENDEAAADEETVDAPADAEGEENGESEEGIDLGLDDPEGEEGEDDVWSSLEDYKDENGEYDLTNCKDDVNIVKVLKAMNDADGVRVVKNDNGTVTLTDDNTEQEYIIDIDGTFSGEENGESEMDTDFGDELEESANLGYTDNYQKKTAMTTPDNHEPADSSKTYSMDGGVPTGTEKPFAGKGDDAPFTETVSEEKEFEIDLDEDCCDGEDCEVNETMTTQEQGAYNRGGGMVYTNSNSKAAKGRNASAAGEKVSGTSDNSYSPRTEAIMRKANEIFAENKELKKLVPELRQQLQECMVITQSMGCIIRLMSENSTTADEKKSIQERFDKVRTREESKQLYQTISEELKRTPRPTLNIESNVQNVQLTESQVNKPKTTPLYESKDIQETLSLIDRMDGVYSKKR